MSHLSDMIKDEASGATIADIVPAANTRTTIIPLVLHHVCAGDYLLLSFKCKASQTESGPQGMDKVCFYVEPVILDASIDGDWSFGIVAGHHPGDMNQLMFGGDNLIDDADTIITGTVLARVKSAQRASRYGIALRAYSLHGHPALFAGQQELSVLVLRY